MSKSDLKIASFFDAWGESGRHNKMSQGHRHAVNQMLDLIRWKNKKSFIDIGCGSGWLVHEVAKKSSIEVAYGIDFSEKMIALANNGADALKEVFINDNFLDWETEKRFDIVFSMEAFYYFSSPSKAIKRVYDLLNNDGFFCIGIDYFQESNILHEFPSDLVLPKKLIQQNEWLTLFRNNGLNVSSIIVHTPTTVTKYKEPSTTLVLYGEKK